MSCLGIKEIWDEFEFEKLFITYDDASDYLNQLLDDENASEKINGIIDYQKYVD